MHLESLESRTLFSAGHTVAVPFHASAQGNLPGNTITGHATQLGQFTGAFNEQGLLILTAANGDQLWASATITPTSDPAVLHVEGSYVGGTGRFEAATGAFSHDVTFTDNQGNFVYDVDTTLTLQRPGNAKA